MQGSRGRIRVRVMHVAMTMAVAWRVRAALQRVWFRTREDLSSSRKLLQRTHYRDAHDGIVYGLARLSRLQPGCLRGN